MNEKGSALISVLIITAVLLTIGAVLLSSIQINLKASEDQVIYQKILLSIKNEFEESASELSEDSAYQGKTSFQEDENGVQIRSTVLKTGTTQYYVKVEGSKNDYTKICQGEIRIDPERHQAEVVRFQLIK